MRPFVRMRFAFALAVPAAAAWAGCGGSPGSRPMAPASPLAGQGATASGKALYLQNCAVCHGDTGKGDGRAAPYLFPKPRDFTSAKYKIRSTPTGELPTDDDLLRSITEGLPGSGMPSFQHLSEAERKELVQIVKSFAVFEGKNRFEERGPGKPIRLPAPPPASPELVARGKKVYFEQGCHMCHGNEGRGDGPSSPTLFDDWGYAIRPNNLQRGIFKGGGDVSDIYMRFVTGMSGTPMPASSETLTDRDRWALAYYVKSLSEGKVAKQTRQTTVIARRIDGPIPTDPENPIYRQATPSYIPMMMLWQRTTAPEEITVRAIHNGKELAVLLEWEDPTVNGRFLRVQDFADAAAVQFPVGRGMPQFPMGDAQNPVNIWHWRFDRQLDTAQFADVEQVYPAMMADLYQSERRKKWQHTGPPGVGSVKHAATHDPTFLTGWGAGNPQSTPNQRTPCQHLVAKGFGTLEALPPERQSLAGRGVWIEGRWHVVIARTMEAASSQEANLAPGMTTFAAFAVWDGEKQDRDGKKLVTYWQKFVIE